MRLDQPHQVVDRQTECPDGIEHLGGHRMALDLAVPGAGQCVDPPLQADFAGQRLADVIAHAGISPANAYSASSARRWAGSVNNVAA